jgi:hypothetical protein
MGGGGGVRVAPSGVLEITPEGTRYVEFGQMPRLAGAFVAGLAVGALLARFRSRCALAASSQARSTPLSR